MKRIAQTSINCFFTDKSANKEWNSLNEKYDRQYHDQLSIGEILQDGSRHDFKELTLRWHHSRPIFN